MRVINQLFNPFSYLTIRHEVKGKVDWIAPAILSTTCTVLLLIFNFSFAVDVFSPNGIVVKTLSFAQSLPGFYIAALAAIATFHRTDIDSVMPAPAPQIEILTDRGQIQDVKLTRRRFLCLMFAFLTAESLVIILLAIFATAISNSLKEITPHYLHVWFKFAFVWSYGFLVWQLIVATFWGLYYLGSKLHEPEEANRGQLNQIDPTSVEDLDDSEAATSAPR